MLPAKSSLHTTKHYAAMDWRELPAFMTKLHKRHTMGAMALAFMIFTAARGGEVRGAAWSEIDMSQATWVIPGVRMKRGHEHRVPLSEPAMDILRLLAEMRSGDLVFPGNRQDRPLADVTMNLNPGVG